MEKIILINFPPLQLLSQLNGLHYNLSGVQKVSRSLSINFYRDPGHVPRVIWGKGGGWRHMGERLPSQLHSLLCSRIWANSCKTHPRNPSVTTRQPPETGRRSHVLPETKHSAQFLFKKGSSHSSHILCWGGKVAACSCLATKILNSRAEEKKERRHHQRKQIPN